MDFFKNLLPNNDSPSPQNEGSSKAFSEELGKLSQQTASEIQKNGGVFSRWGQFFDKSAVKIPSVLQARSRIESNMRYFWVNYLVLFGVLTLYALFTNLTLLFATGIAGGLWYFLFNREEPIVIAGVALTDTIKKIIMIPVILLLFWFFGNSSLLWIVGFFITFVLVHALLIDEDHRRSLPQ